MMYREMRMTHWLEKAETVSLFALDRPW